MTERWTRSPQQIREQAFVASGDADTTIPGVAHAPECEGRTRSPLRFLFSRASRWFVPSALPMVVLMLGDGSWGTRGLW